MNFGRTRSDSERGFLHGILTSCLVLIISMTGIPANAQNKKLPDDGINKLSYTIKFYVNKYDIVENFRSNEVELSKLDDFMTEILQDKTILIRSFRLSGTCSIEGSYENNARLAPNRANEVRDYLNEKYKLSEQYPTSVSAVEVEDWSTLRKQVAESTLETKSEIIQIIDSKMPPEKKKARLRALDHGEPYNYMLTHFFPDSRRVNIDVLYEQLTPRVIVDTLLIRKTVVDTMFVDKPCPDPMDMGERYIYPIFAVKTNLLQWAGIPYPFEYKSYLPNIGVEVYFAKRWSAHADFAYSYHEYDEGDKFQGISSYGLEGRFWFKKDSRFRWFYAGLYGQSGDYDDQVGRIDSQTTYTNNTGKYWSAGVTAGVMIPIYRELCAEFTLHGGYRHYYDNVYDRELPHNYYNYTVYKDKWGITGAYVNLVYRFSKTSKIKK